MIYVQKNLVSWVEKKQIKKHIYQCKKANKGFCDHS